MGDGLKRARAAALETQGLATCNGDVWNGWNWVKGCHNRAKRDGYCLRHHPQVQAEKAAARQAKWQVESDLGNQRRLAQERVQDAREAIVQHALQVWSDHNIVRELLDAEAAFALLGKGRT